MGWIIPLLVQNTQKYYEIDIIISKMVIKCS